MSTIIEIYAREILDSRGNPTIEVECITESGAFGRAEVPSGASTGKREAIELRDNDASRYLGKGVQNAVKNVNEIIAPEVIGEDVLEQRWIDKLLLEIDGTENKSRLGANAILGVSMAVAKAGADYLGVPLYKYIGGLSSHIIPVPQMNILNGGKHAGNNLEMQEFMIFPYGAPSFKEALRYGSEVFHTLKNLLKERGFSTGVGDEGGFSPNLDSNEEPLKLIVEAIEKAGYTPGKDIGIAIDPAANSFYNNGKYIIKGNELSSDDMISLYEDWCNKYPLVSIEDGLAEDDWDGWVKMTERIGNKIQIVGDDIYVTNPEYIQKGIEKKASNAALIKLNQIGTLTETVDAVNLTHKNGWNTVISHRSGETEDTSIAHLAVAVGSGQIKTGSVSRSERIAKYNELLRIEEEIGEIAIFIPPKFIQI